MTVAKIRGFDSLGDRKDIVMYPRYLNLKADPTACTSLFLYKVGRVLYGRRRYTPEYAVWTTPGGRCNQGETIEENLRRETYEETGITGVLIRRFLGICPGAKEGDTLYVYEGSTPMEPTRMKPEKFSQWRWFDPRATPRGFINPAALKLFHQNFTG